MVHMVKIASWQMITQMMIFIFIVNLILGLSTYKSEGRREYAGKYICVHLYIEVRAWAWEGTRVYAFCRCVHVSICRHELIIHILLRRSSG